MPLNPYECTNCQYYFEEIQQYDDQPLVICPRCNKNALLRQFGLPNSGIPRTVGTFAEHQARKMSEDEKAARAEQYRTKPVSPSGWKLRKPNES